MTAPATVDSAPAPATLPPLRPDSAQRTFRAVLGAFAQPGSVQQLPTAPLAQVPAALLPVLALADLDIPSCVLAEPDAPRWADALATATNAPEAALGTARLVAALRPLRPEELSDVPRGSAAAPEEGALVVMAVPELDGGPPLRLCGPGIADERIVAPRGLPTGLLAARAQAVAAFPAGLDLVLVTADGRLLGLPRSTRIRAGDEQEEK